MSILMLKASFLVVFFYLQRLERAYNLNMPYFVIILVSDDISLMTGEVIKVDGDVHSQWANW